MPVSEGFDLYAGWFAEPFEIRAALEGLEPSPEGYKLIRVLDVGSFDSEEPKGE